MRKQKRIAAINDLAGYGKCALSAAIPVISAMGVECCPVPTALLSTNAAFAGYDMEDCTEQTERLLSHWEELGLEFDGISLGFFASERQIDIVREFLSKRKGASKVFFDPVMGDHGKLYSASKPAVCEKMRELLPFVDILTPNLTEACRLAGLEYPFFFGAGEKMPVFKPVGIRNSTGETPLPEQMGVCFSQLGHTLCNMGVGTVVITGIDLGDRLINYIYTEGEEPVLVGAKRSGGERCGTGDTFAAVVCAGVVCGMSVDNAVRCASTFLTEVLAYTDSLGVSPRNGVFFEPFLGKLGAYLSEFGAGKK